MKLNNDRENGNWKQVYDMSIDESYSIIQLDEVPSQDIQFNLKKVMNRIARSFGFHMIDFRVNFVYFVFVNNFNACFYQSSNVKNFGNFVVCFLLICSEGVYFEGRFDA